MILLKSLLLESKQSIINLGYPEIIAKMFYEKFGNKAYILAKWYKDYHSPSYTNYNDKNWWILSMGHHLRTGITVADLTKLYYSTSNYEEYLKTLKDLEFSYDDVDNSEIYLKKQREIIKKEIEEKFFNTVFFDWFGLTKDIISGKLKDTQQYEKLPFLDAALKYDERKIFSETKPIKVYKNGFKWIDVGKRCHLMGHFMKNCGSAGVMSGDKDRTMLGLFDINNKPHIVVTYSPNEKRISGDEGVASTESKQEYHKYILDLANTLGAVFDVERTKSKLLMLKYMLKNKATNVKQIKAGKNTSSYEEYFKFNVGNDVYYSNGFYVVSSNDIQKASELVKSGQIKLSYNFRNKIRDVFNHYNIEILKDVIKYIYIKQFVEKQVANAL